MAQNVLISILILADLAVCGVVIFSLFRGRRQDKGSVDTVRLTTLVDSLRDLVRESDRASKSLLDALKERHKKTEELFWELDRREGKLMTVMKEAEKLGSRPAGSKETGAYHEVSRLADLGFSAEEIARRVEVPKGEIELILGLKE